MNSGPNQHYIPKFLLRGFGIRKRRVEIWHFGVDEPPERRRIKRTGSDDCFYSRPSVDGEPTLDDAISALEPGLAETHRDMRSKLPEEAVDPDEAAAIVSHLLVRTAHFRSSFLDGVARLLGRIEALFGEPAKVRQLAGLDSDAPTKRFQELLASDLTRSSEIATLGIPQQLRERVAFVVLKEASADLLGQSRELVSLALDEIRSQLGEQVRKGHNKALGQATGSTDYRALLRRFKWTVESAPKSGAILPDCVVIAFCKDGIASTPLFVGGEDLRAVVMAVSAERLLVGRRPGFELPADFDYNLEAARMSHSFFLSPRKDAETLRLHAIIGEQFRHVLEEAIEAASEGLLPEVDSDSPAQTGPEPVLFEWRPTKRATYDLTLVACGDMALRERIQKSLKALIDHVAKTLPLERLDGITTGPDYPALLLGVDRGFEGACTLETEPAGIGVGLAETVIVKRSDAIKGRVVMSSAVCEALISDDPEAAGWAVDILVTLLAQVALIGVVDERLPGRLLAPVENEMDGWLYANIDGAPELYVASRIASEFIDGRKARDGLRGSLLDSLDRLRSVAAEERLLYDRHGDTAKLLSAVLPAIRHVLTAAADLYGQCSFSGDSPLDDSGSLAESLDRLELRAWFKEYGGHLERFHGRLGKWESFDEFLDFNLHVERLLWSVGMFVWKGPKGLTITIATDWDSHAFDPTRVSI